MLVTSLEKQKHDAKRYSIFIDGQFAFGLNEVDVLWYKLKEGREITQEQYDDILHNVIYMKCKDAAINYLAFKARTEKEVVQKLRDKEFPEDVIEKTIEFLKQYHYIDDISYARSFIKEKSRLKKHGSIKISYDLKQKGIDAEGLFEESEIDEVETAVVLITKKAKKPLTDYKEKSRLFNLLLRRGFPSDVVKEAFNRCQAPLEEEGSI